MKRNIPLPSHSELAALAASIPSTATPAAKARTAVEIWEACGNLLEQRRALYQSATARDERLLALLPDVEPGAVLDFDAFLAAVMPKKKRADRMATWRRYLRDPGPDGTMDEARIAEVIERDRKRGIDSPHMRADAFLRWLERDEARTRSEKGRKGAEGKNRKTAKKSLGRKKSG